MMTAKYIEAMLKGVAEMHHKFETETGKADDNWPAWYAEKMIRQMHHDFGSAPVNPLSRSTNINNRRMLRGH